MAELIARERTQLLAHWTKVFGGGRCWLTTSPPQLQRVLSSDVDDLGMRLRKLHDKLGYCAKGTVRTGGLCAGAIYRTGAFVATAQEDRSGAKVNQTVHIEHTVPVNVLAWQVGAQALAEVPVGTGLAWLLKHSVTTAMRKGQDRDYLKGQTRSTEAFTRGHAHLHKPFRRYNDLFTSGEIVWDVFAGKAVDADEITFDSHHETVLRLVAEAGAAPSFVRALEAA